LSSATISLAVIFFLPQVACNAERRVDTYSRQYPASPGLPEPLFIPNLSA
jgi:hypothetical protein